MNRKKFIKVLERKDYSYEIEGDKIVITDVYTIYLDSLTSLPPGVVFENFSSVHLDSLTSLPPGIVFDNEGDVFLNSLTSLPPDVVFDNKRDVRLESLIGGWFSDWKGNIKGIDRKRLLNKMISIGIFER
jgi:hypothetical protein